MQLERAAYDAAIGSQGRLSKSELALRKLAELENRVELLEGQIAEMHSQYFAALRNRLIPPDPVKIPMNGSRQGPGES